MSAQYVLPMRDSDRAFVSSMKVRAALRAFASAIGHKQLAALWGLTLADDTPDERTVGLKLDESNRHFVKLHELIAVLQADTRGLVMEALCEACGFEAPERKVEPASEVERLLAAARELFGPDVLELLRRRSGV